MSRLTRIALLCALSATLAPLGQASTRSHFHRRDAAIEASAASILKEEGLTDAIHLRSVRGRLVLDASGVAPARLEALASRLKRETGALSVSR